MRRSFYPNREKFGVLKQMQKVSQKNLHQFGYGELFSYGGVHGESLAEKGLGSLGLKGKKKVVTDLFSENQESFL